MSNRNHPDPRPPARNAADTRPPAGEGHLVVTGHYADTVPLAAVVGTREQAQCWADEWTVARGPFVGPAWVEGTVQVVHLAETSVTVTPGEADYLSMVSGTVDVGAVHDVDGERYVDTPVRALTAAEARDWAAGLLAAAAWVESRVGTDPAAADGAR